MMLVKVVLVDVNPKMVAAWRTSFEENPEVDIVHGSMLDQPVSAWVSPTNAAGNMDGGLDAVIKKHLGRKIESALRKTIKREYGGALPVGHAVCTPSGAARPRFVISTPTMTGSSDDVSDTLNVALAAAAALQAVQLQNVLEPGSIRSLALPGLGANTGQVPVEICADLMWTAYSLLREQSFASFAELRPALEQQLGDLSPMTSVTPEPKAVSAPKPAPPAKAVDDDFDDFE